MKLLKNVNHTPITISHTYICAFSSLFSNFCKPFLQYVKGAFPLFILSCKLAQFWDKIKYYNCYKCDICDIILLLFQQCLPILVSQKHVSKINSDPWCLLSNTGVVLHFTSGTNYEEIVSNYLVLIQNSAN